MAAIPDSHFVDCELGTGDYLPWMTRGRVELASVKSRKGKLVLRQHRRVQVQRPSPLSRHLLVADLVRIPGLDNYVRDRNWLQVDNIRVYDLVSRLFSMLIKQEDRIRTGEQELRSTRFERDGVSAALQDTERELSSCERELERFQMELRQARRERDDHGYAHQPSSSHHFGNPYAGQPSNPGIRKPYARQPSSPGIRNIYAGEPSTNIAAPRSPFIPLENRTDFRRANDDTLPPVPRRAPIDQTAQDRAWFQNHGDNFG